MAVAAVPNAGVLERNHMCDKEVLRVLPWQSFAVQLCLAPSPLAAEALTLYTLTACTSESQLIVTAGVMFLVACVPYAENHTTIVGIHLLDATVATAVAVRHVIRDICQFCGDKTVEPYGWFADW